MRPQQVSFMSQISPVQNGPYSSGNKGVFYLPQTPGTLGVGAEFCIAVDIANFGGDVMLSLCVAYWIYLIHIQLGSLGLREIDARDP